MSVHDLTDEQIAFAREQWAAGRTLGGIAEDLTCSIYDLSPWLYMEAIASTREDSC